MIVSSATALVALDKRARVAQSGGVRSRDVRAGSTYRVEIPQRITGAQAEDLRMTVLSGCMFDLTVIDVDTACTPATVQGIRTLTRIRVVLPLTIEQEVDLGLTPGAHEVVGYVQRAGGGDPIELPVVETLTVPVRWLHALDSVPSRNHRDITGRAW